MARPRVQVQRVGNELLELPTAHRTHLARLVRLTVVVRALASSVLALGWAVVVLVR